MIGTDGMQLLIAVQAETAIDGLAHLPAVEILRQTDVTQTEPIHEALAAKDLLPLLN